MNRSPASVPAARYTSVQTALQLFALASLVIAQTVLSTLNANAEIFLARNTRPAELVSLVVVLILIPPLILTTLTMAFGSINSLWRSWSAGVMVGLLLGLFVLQVAGKASASTTVSIGLAILALIAGVYAYMRFPAVGRFLVYLAPAPLLVAGLFLLTGPASSIVLPDSSPRSIVPSASSTAPVIFILLDELPEVSLMSAEQRINDVRFPNFARLARESTWYRNSAPTAPYSTRSVSGLLTGSWPKPDTVPLASEYPVNLFTALSQTHDMNVVEPITALCPEAVCGEARSATFKEVLELGRISVELYQRILLPAIYVDTPIALDDPFATNVDEVFSSNRISGFRRFLASIDGRDSRLHFGHFLLPHAPFQYLPSGTSYNGGSQVIPALNEDGYWSGEAWHTFEGHQRHLLQLKAVDGLIGELLDHLESIDAYDKSLIVVTSDHGVSHVPGDARRDVTDTSLYDIGLVPLFIKAPGQTIGSIDDRPMRGIDVVPTVMELLGATNAWPGDGLSPRAHEGPVNLEMEDQDHVRVTIDVDGDGRSIAIQRVIDRFGPGSSNFDLYAFSPHADLVGLSAEQLSASSSRLEATVENSGNLLLVDGNSGFIPAYIEGSLSGLDSVAGLPHLALALNGIIGTVVPLHDVVGDAARFGGLLPERLFTDGANELDILAVFLDGDRTQMEEVDHDAPRLFQLESTEGGAPHLLATFGDSVDVHPDFVTGFVDTVVHRNGQATISGWAIDARTMVPVDEVVAFIGDRIVAANRPSLPRKGLAEELRNPDVLNSGYSLSIPDSALKTGIRGDLRFFGISEGRASELIVIESADEALLRMFGGLHSD